MSQKQSIGGDRMLHLTTEIILASKASLDLAEQTLQEQHRNQEEILKRMGMISHALRVIWESAIEVESIRYSNSRRRKAAIKRWAKEKEQMEHEQRG